MNQQDNDAYLLPNEVAALMHVSPKTVARWASQQKLPHVKTLGGHRRFRAGEILPLIAELRISGLSLEALAEARGSTLAD